MDSPVHEIRLNNRAKIVGTCRSGLKGISQKHWIEDNGMTRSQYY